MSWLLISLFLPIFWLQSPQFTEARPEPVVFDLTEESSERVHLALTSLLSEAAEPAPVSSLLQATTACDTYYLREQTMPVGDAGTQRIANTTVPTGASPDVIQATLPLLSETNIEIARFYSDPVVPLEYPIIGDIVSSLWLQSTDFSNTTFTMNIFDYDPADGDLINLGNIEFIIITDGQNEVELVTTPPGGVTIAANHRLLLILHARSPVLTAPTVSLFFNSTERSSHFAFCHPALPELSITKSGPSATVAGQPITYTLTIANDGGLAATNLAISDTIPNDATHISGGDLNGGVVSWSVDSLAPDSSIQRTFVVAASQTVTNDDYLVTADGNFSAVGEDAVTTIVSPPGQPNLVISKHGPSEVRIGEPIVYTLTITNSGDVAASGLRITDTLPTDATYINGGTLKGNVVSWLTETPLGPQESVQYSFVVTATKAITNENYLVTAAPDISTVGQKAITTQVIPRMLYLPLTMKNDATLLKTTLRIESVNTGGISLVRILQANNNVELLRCTSIGDNTTVTCGQFNAVGSYKLIATTNNCGSLQGTFHDASPGATITRTVFCN